LIGVELASKSAANLCFLVAVEAENRQIRKSVVARIVIDVVDLDWLPPLATHTASPVGCEENLGCELRRDPDSIFGRG
jgi:hypothetical protein